jgi:hypothetical protein
MFQFAFVYAYAKQHKLDRYYQDPKFFKSAEADIKAIFQEGLTDPIDMVAIHVRRGDYVNNSFYVDLTKTNYYEKAMDEFPDAQFLVFSDDIEWCKQQLIFKDCEFYHGDELDDLNTMASCVGHIIANSSFSWWGAYISPFTDKVVCPSYEHWYTDGQPRTVTPKEWIKI